MASYFNEENTVEQMVLDTLRGAAPASHVAEASEDYLASHLTLHTSPLGWRYVAADDLPRQHSEVFVESMLREALIRLNPDITAQPDRADEVLYRLRTIPLSVQSSGLVRANEFFTEWLRGEKTMPFGERGEHTPVRLIDFEHPEHNEYIVTNQWVYPTREGGKRFDIVLLVNGLPLVIGEAKTPVRPAVTWVDGASDIHNGYEQSVPQMFAPNLFSFATEGKCFRYGSVRMPIDIWGPWHDPTNKHEGTLADVQRSLRAMLRPDILLDILQNFTIFATDKKHRRIKIICRYQQYEAANLIVQRVVRGAPKKGLIWHFQGSGKSLLMVFAAQKLRMHPRLKNPTVLIVVDRLDLDTQITATFNAADIPNLVGVNSRQELQTLLAQDIRKILITTIHKFGEVDTASRRIKNADSDSSTELLTSTAERSDYGQAGSSLYSFFDPDVPIAFLSGNLPHWRQEGVTYFVTFRLADSMPQEKLQQWLAEREQWLKAHPEPHSRQDKEEYHRLFTERFHAYLDAGYGSCILEIHEVKKLVENALGYFDGARYSLGEFVIMPNHVHVLVSPLNGHELSNILHSWKSFTAHEILKVAAASRRLKQHTVWQKESFDHIVRSPQSLERFIQYIRENPLEISQPQRDAVNTFERRDVAATALNERSNIIVMVDEAHRTQEGDLGRQMRAALPNAFLFGLTGTPINKSDRNTFWAFGADEDDQGYMSRYSFQDSIRDNATLPLHFEAVDVRLHIDKDAINEAYAAMTGSLSDQDRDDLAKQAAKMAVLIKAPERVQAICDHIVTHFRDKVEPNGFKAQIVTYDRECCVLYKNVLDTLIDPEASAIVMSTPGGKGDEFAQWKLDKDAEEKLLDRFRDPADPLNFLIVTSKLLTGFDAPILQVMYLDKPMRDHNLLQAICRTNRIYTGKTHGLIVDYLGIFDEVATALDFDEKAVQKVITNLDELKKELPKQVTACLAFFPNIDRTIGGYEGLMAAQDCLPDNTIRDAFAAQYSVLAKLWEALSPDSCLQPYKTDYTWLTQVYESVKPPSGHGKLLWHALGAKTIELVHDNVHLDTVRDDLDTLVMDADVLEGLLEGDDPDKKSKEIEIKLVARLRKHKNNPIFVALGERLEKLKERHEQGLLHSLDFLKELLTLAKETVQAEKTVNTVDEQEQAKAALTELFTEVKTGDTPVMVERLVTDIDEIVRLVRFPGWQNTSAGERDVQKALRKVLYVKYKIKDQDLFDKAYGYIRQYY